MTPQPDAIPTITFSVLNMCGISDETKTMAVMAFMDSVGADMVVGTETKLMEKKRTRSGIDNKLADEWRVIWAHDDRRLQGSGLFIGYCSRLALTHWEYCPLSWVWRPDGS